eukprot:m.347249 g.347249  ORF g.347249 m.347249 type:complete len:1537 (+) comp16144_c0_seq26:211-4821(+)
MSWFIVIEPDSDNELKGCISLVLSTKGVEYSRTVPQRADGAGDQSEEASARGYRVTSLPPGLETFCYPTVDHLATRSSPRAPFFFSTTLTSEDGSRLFCVCLGFDQEHAPKISEGKVPESANGMCVYKQVVIAFVGKQPILTALRLLLREVYQAYAQQQLELLHSTIASALVAAAHLKPGKAGSSIQLPLSQSKADVYVSPSSTLQAPHEVVSLLFQCLSPADIVKLVLGALFEHKLVLVSDKHCLLHAANEAILQLLFPFTYAFVAIPVLPDSLLDFVAAPTPYMMGVHRLSFDRMDTLDDVIVADLDTGQVTYPSGDNALHIPVPTTATLLQRTLTLILHPQLAMVDRVSLPGLNAEIKMVSTRHQEVCYRMAFLRFFVALMADYREFYCVTRFAPTFHLSLDRAAFLDHRRQVYEAVHGAKSPKVAVDMEFIEVFISSMAFGQLVKSQSRRNYLATIFDDLIDQHVAKNRYVPQVFYSFSNLSYPAAPPTETSDDVDAGAVPRVNESDSVSQRAAPTVPVQAVHEAQATMLGSRSDQPTTARPINHTDTDWLHTVRAFVEACQGYAADTEPDHCCSPVILGAATNFGDSADVTTSILGSMPCRQSFHSCIVNHIFTAALVSSSAQITTAIATATAQDKQLLLYANGPRVPNLRPQAVSTADASEYAVVLEALDCFKKSERDAVTWYLRHYQKLLVAVQDEEMAFFAAEQFVLIFNKWHMPLSSMMFDIATKFISALLTHEPASIKNTVPKRPVDRVAMTLLLPIAEGYTQALNVRKYIFHELGQHRLWAKIGFWSSSFLWSVNNALATLYAQHLRLPPSEVVVDFSLWEAIQEEGSVAHLEVTELSMLLNQLTLFVKYLIYMNVPQQKIESFVISSATQCQVTRSRLNQLLDTIPSMIAFTRNRTSLVHHHDDILRSLLPQAIGYDVAASATRFDSIAPQVSNLLLHHELLMDTFNDIVLVYCDGIEWSAAVGCVIITNYRVIFDGVRLPSTPTKERHGKSYTRWLGTKHAKRLGLLRKRKGRKKKRKLRQITEQAGDPATTAVEEPALHERRHRNEGLDGAQDVGHAESRKPDGTVDDEASQAEQGESHMQRANATKRSSRYVKRSFSVSGQQRASRALDTASSDSKLCSPRQRSGTVGHALRRKSSSPDMAAPLVPEMTRVRSHSTISGGSDFADMVDETVSVLDIMDHVDDASESDTDSDAIYGGDVEGAEANDGAGEGDGVDSVDRDLLRSSDGPFLQSLGSSASVTSTSNTHNEPESVVAVFTLGSMAKVGRFTADLNCHTQASQWVMEGVTVCTKTHQVFRFTAVAGSEDQVSRLTNSLNVCMGRMTIENSFALYLSNAQGDSHEEQSRTEVTTAVRRALTARARATPAYQAPNPSGQELLSLDSFASNLSGFSAGHSVVEFLPEGHHATSSSASQGPSPNLAACIKDFGRLGVRAAGQRRRAHQHWRLSNVNSNTRSALRIRQPSRFRTRPMMRRWHVSPYALQVSAFPFFHGSTSTPTHLYYAHRQSSTPVMSSLPTGNASKHPR